MANQMCNPAPGRPSHVAGQALFARGVVFCAVLLLPSGQLNAEPEVMHSTDKSNQSTTQVGGNLDEAKALLEKGNIDDAERAARQYIEQHSDSAEAHFLLGLILFRKIQADAVLQSQLVTKAPAPMGTVNTLGANSSDPKSKNELAKASLAEFTAGAKLHDPSAYDLKIVALDYVLLGDYADADKWLTRSLQWGPKDSEGWYYLGRTKYNENRFGEAARAFEQCLQLDPKNVKAEDNLGLTYAGLGRNEDAAAAYKTAMEWQAAAPLKNAGPYINLGSLLLDENRPDEAAPYLLQAVEIAPRESRAHEFLGKAYVRLEQLPKAQTELEKAIELSPDSPNLYCMLAPVYRKQGLVDKAKAEFERCATLTSSHSVPPAPRQ
jgi:Flp pilus assembly protein TadD